MLKKIAITSMAIASFATSPAKATLVSVNVSDDIYGNFAGSVIDGANGAAATLTWMSAGYGWIGNIGLTDALGNILFDVQSANDSYTLFAPGSGDTLLGTDCDSNASACVQVVANVPTSLLNAVSSVNGGLGFCCGGSDIVVTAAALAGSVPEPTSWTLMMIGMGVVGFGARRRVAVPISYSRR